MSSLFNQAEQFLAALDPQWAAHVQAIGPCLHQPRPERDPYQALVRAIAYQQLHVKAGDAILGRFLALYPGCAFPSPEQVLATSPEQLRACGFSASKLATILGIAKARQDGVVPDHEQALALDDEQLIERLVSLRGVGRWTVEMLLIYTLERMDILPVDDFGVREGYRRLQGLDTQPTRRQMLELGQAWSPYRTIAAWYLWRVPNPRV
ncbi:DNA-3-methyladenine glycosylase 2 family protein [Pseudomonas alkylphenolica]|uniref:DNA-3-methyladenine glycosylase II n=1 Tax=Pseudomonas alkylphenolica TaxID=237609 RepID=A0A6I6GWD2_9PSED|nr:DNA-3-methyladenine glycosylase [Pseudomonas alkylphenolica]QGW78823.1 DNA-3-methyladenine glycosylase 2 family protein [Pseudomonas alkylphenolica]